MERSETSAQPLNWKFPGPPSSMSVTALKKARILVYRQPRLRPEGTVLHRRPLKKGWFHGDSFGKLALLLLSCIGSIGYNQPFGSHSCTRSSHSCRTRFCSKNAFTYHLRQVHRLTCVETVLRRHTWSGLGPSFFEMRAQESWPASSHLTYQGSTQTCP